MTVNWQIKAQLLKWYSEKLTAENICKTTICQEEYPEILRDNNDPSNFEFSEKHIKITIMDIQFDNQPENSKVVLNFSMDP